MKDGTVTNGELSTDAVIKILKELKKVNYVERSEEYEAKVKELREKIPKRELAFCAGCPHRASFWAIKNAIALDGRDVFVAGDIGCYTMGMFKTGFYLPKTSHCMDAAIGLSSGFKNLNKPVIALAGDSTFFHACIPGLINAKYNNANVLFIVLDNSATAMTGFQPHPGIGINAMGVEAPATNIEEVCRGIGVKVQISDPFDFENTVKRIYDMLQSDKGARVLIFQKTCGIIESRSRGERRVYVDRDKCKGEECGCMRFCTRNFNCPGIMWDREEKKARIDEVVCNGCGVCATLCPVGAIVVEEKDFS